jgi:hypothetical protein
MPLRLQRAIVTPVLIRVAHHVIPVVTKGVVIVGVVRITAMIVIIVDVVDL